MSEDRWIASLDVGSTGDDPSVLCLRRGPAFVEFVVFREPDLMRMVGLVDVALRDRGLRLPRRAPDLWDAPPDLAGGPPAGWDDGAPPSAELAALVVDVIGVGDGAARRLEELGWPVVRFHSSARARDPQRFANARAECHWRLREGLETGALSFTRCEALAEEILAVRWRTNPKTGAIEMERKGAVRKRLGRSPDHLDAAAMSLAADESASGLVALIDI